MTKLVDIPENDSRMMAGMLDYFNAGTDDLEYEMRFKNINAKFYYTLYGALQKIVKPTVYVIEDYSCNNLRYTAAESGYTVIEKTRIDVYDMPKFDTRIALSNEKKLPYVEKLPDNTKATLRSKKRASFSFGTIVIDMTIVNDSEFEIELEMQKGCDYKVMVDMMYYVLKVKQGSPIITGTDDAAYIVKLYNDLVGPKFAGIQPVTLHGDDLKELYSKKYAVTRKIDGERRLLLVDDKHNVFLIDSNMQPSLTRLVCKTTTHTVLDCELQVLPDSSMIVHVFDALVFNGADIRDDETIHLRKRLDIVDTVIQDIVEDSATRALVKVVAKEYYFKNIFTAARILHSKSTEQDDGLIFMREDVPYPVGAKKNIVFKWKPSHLNTIDFLSVKGGSNTWQLYVTAKPTGKKSKSNVSATMPFDVEKITGTATCNTSTTVFDDSLLDPTTGLAYASDTVIEYKYDISTKMFVPLRTRWDKTVNPQKQGNFVTVALDIWKNILNPVSISNITSLSKTYNLVYYKELYTACTTLKRLLYKTYPSNFLLDLACGKGCDTVKWPKRAHAYDTNSAILKRNEKYKDRLFFNTEPSSAVVKQNAGGELFDTVVCHSAVNQYFKSLEALEGLVQTLDVNLKQGGVFITSFIDSAKLSELPEYKVVDREVMYYLHREVRAPKTFGNELKVQLNGDTLSTEYIVDCSFFTEFMDKRGYAVQDSKLFSQVLASPELKEYESDIYALQRYIVFKKQDVIPRIINTVP